MFKRKCKKQECNHADCYIETANFPYIVPKLGRLQCRVWGGAVLHPSNNIFGVRFEIAGREFSIHVPINGSIDNLEGFLIAEIKEAMQRLREEERECKRCGRTCEHK